MTNHLTDTFVVFNQSLKNMPADVVEQAIKENPWFSQSDIEFQINALCTEFLDTPKLNEWAMKYPQHTQTKPMTVGIVAAGNIPMAAFGDLFYTIVSGHICLLKTSSRDRALMTYAATKLHEINPSVKIEVVDELDKCDVLIVSGSDETCNLYRHNFPDTPQIIRGHRTGVAVLNGSETEEILYKLNDDIFRYNGLGCRSVTKLFVPEGYDFYLLSRALKIPHTLTDLYALNLRRLKAELTVNSTPFIDCADIILRADSKNDADTGEILYETYSDFDVLNQRLESLDGTIQCIACEDDRVIFSRRAAFGKCQHPTLGDYSDGIDVMDFLANLEN